MKRISLARLIRPPRGFRLTKSGYIFFAFLLALIVTAMATGNNLLFLILAGMLAFMIVSGVESELNIRHLQVARSLPAEIYAGVSSSVAYTVRNPRRNSSRLFLEDRGRIRLPAISRRFPESASQATVFKERGRHLLGRVTILTTFPYGLFEKTISFDLEDEVIVFPSPVPCPLLSNFGPSGERNGSSRDSISHVRPYAPGDSLSSVAWKKQRAGLTTRVMQGGGGGVGSVVVIHPGGSLEEKLGMAAFIVNELMGTGVSFGVSLNSYFSGMGTSVEHKLAILKTLALTEHLAEPEYRDFAGGTHVVRL